MKRKFLSVLTAVCIATVCTVSAAAFTYGGTDGANEADFTAETQLGSDIEVKATVTVADVVHKYAVDLDGTIATFAYAFGERTWNPTNHTYELTGTDSTGWTNTDATFTVTNHSDLQVNVTAAATSNAAVGSNVTVSVTPLNSSLEKCPVDSGNGVTAPSVTGTISVAGKPAMNAVTDTTIGTVTVKISPVSSGTTTP